ncbi:hypothetical protein [Selenomonas ruminantium]|uniref:Lipoprotein n=1 Tax=Selenomonas ruminantium TaxID=971 RepID=A0A1H3Z9G3_SELRU|nr:hypothetical protein [Selenomonas ruminantium]SEA20433.1 hypothetical protein SAMN05660648_02360 [Selenomonas ruminantium]
MKSFRNVAVALLCLFTIFIGGCSNNSNSSKSAAPQNSQDKKTVETILKEHQQQQKELEAKKRQEQEEAKRLQEEEKKKQESANVFQYSNFTLYHEYNDIIPYNGIKMSFVVSNNSNSVQILRLSDFVLRKKGCNTILPEKALRGYTGIAKNPDNPDFSEYDNVLNQREIYPGDSFLVKIEFWEQREIIRSLEGWCLAYKSSDGIKNICNLHD